ncbi:MAG: hypothetical protein IJO71_12495 [Microbacterium sp.]|uniref:hypothetical protein n=1 Tax=Microbacterium sp. TaxID=51671 RepID=UPI0025FBB93F|nr:hypothetical protein [Microbacterium sp.]MBQ9918002.1 hypothetical protein [Microbacterium sp.]
MTYTQTHILLSEAWPDTLTPDASNFIANYVPANGWTCESASLLTFEGRFAGWSPAPVAGETREWALVPQIGIAHTTSYQRSRPGWRDVAPAELGITAIGASIMTTGTPRIVIATDASATAIFQIRVPVDGIGRFRWRNLITYTGTKPGVKTSLTLIEKGETL